MFIQILSVIPPPLLVKVKALEKLNKHKVAAPYGVLFNETGIEEDLLPEYTMTCLCELKLIYVDSPFECGIFCHKLVNSVTYS